MTIKKEFCSSSLKDAIAKAADEFRMPEDKIKYEIITEKTRYFGHSQREIYINAWPSDGTEEESLSQFISEMIKKMSLALDFQVTDGKGFLKVNFSGEDYKLMLYQNGNLLNAVQYILNRLFSDTVGKKIYCECEKFRRNRENELSGLAHRYAKNVRKTGKAITLNELNPFERRVVHMTINKYEDLESKSTGDRFTKLITIRKK